MGFVIQCVKLIKHHGLYGLYNTILNSKHLEESKLIGVASWSTNRFIVNHPLWWRSPTNQEIWIHCIVFLSSLHVKWVSSCCTVWWTIRSNFYYYLALHYRHQEQHTPRDHYKFSEGLLFQRMITHCHSPCYITSRCTSSRKRIPASRAHTSAIVTLWSRPRKEILLPLRHEYIFDYHHNTGDGWMP